MIERTAGKWRATVPYRKRERERESSLLWVDDPIFEFNDPNGRRMRKVFNCQLRYTININKQTMKDLREREREREMDCLIK